MKISITSDELKALVEKEVSSMGFSGSFNIEFRPRKGGDVETEIDILPAGTKTTVEPQIDSDAQNESVTKY